MDQEGQERLKEVLKDEAYVKELLATERPEDVQASLEEKGVELTVDEIKQVGELIKKIQSGEISQEQVQRAADGELTEDELEEVAGGSLIGALLIVGTLIAGVGVTVGLGFGFMDFVKRGW